MSEISNVGRKYTDIRSEETFAPGELSKAEPTSNSSSTTMTKTIELPGFVYVDSSKTTKTIDEQGLVHIESEQNVSDAARFAGTKITGAAAEVKASSIFSFFARG